MIAADTGYDRDWNQVGRFAGYFSGGALLVIVALTLADGLGIIGSAPPYKSTAAGPTQDEVNYWIGFFGHQRQIVWDIFARDSLQALADLAIIAVGLAVLNLVGPRRAIAQLAVASLGIGAILPRQPSCRARLPRRGAERSGNPRSWTWRSLLEFPDLELSLAKVRGPR